MTEQTSRPEDRHEQQGTASAEKEAGFCAGGMDKMKEMMGAGGCEGMMKKMMTACCAPAGSEESAEKEA